ncbi:MAG: response regulator, partial [Pseudomonadota bacterium]
METIKEKILIVDDTADTVELLRKRFRAEGYDTMEAFDGEEALAKIAENRPDLVILDVMMPKLDGFGVCKRLREDPATRHLPVLMLTAKSETPDKVRGLDIGADDYITKPFDYKELAARVRSLLSKKTANKEMAEKEKSEALDHMVDEVSHEVRNPLVAIGGFARRMLKNMAADDKNRPYMEIILQNVASLERMVTELIELKGAALAFREPLDIHSLIRESLALFAAEIKSREITVTLDLMDNPPQLAVDRENFGRAIF